LLSDVRAVPQVRQEIEVMRHLYHRNVVLLFEVIDDPDEDCLYMILEVSPVPSAMKACTNMML
jgi:calcium/calmodulin-dependent protein kinase kinase 2